MSTSRTRGRTVPRRKNISSMIVIGVIGLAVIGLLGVGLVAALGSRRSPVADSRIPVEQAVRPLNAPTGVTPEGYAYKGSPDAPVKVVEYADFECPGCANAEEVFGEQLNRYAEEGQIQFIYHELPLPQHPNAIPAATAARCAGEQGRFWAMHDLLFARQREWRGTSNITPRLVRYAEELGLDRAAFEQCLNAGKYAQALEQAAQQAEQAGVTGTPTFFVNGQRVETAALIEAIEAALQAGGN